MTNFEKKKDECMDVLASTLAVVKGKPVACRDANCSECELYEKNVECREQAVKWLFAEYKEPVNKLTKQERIFLDSIFKEEGYKVSRGCFGLYMVFGEEDVVCARLNENMFKFIKRGEIWTFEDLLKLEVEE